MIWHAIRKKNFALAELKRCRIEMFVRIVLGSKIMKQFAEAGKKEESAPL